MMELSVKLFEGAPKVPLGELIHQRREKAGNADLPVRGVSREGFINPKQEEADKTKYNVFYLNDFVFNPARMEVNSIALNSEVKKGICSSLYEIFSVDETRVIPEFLNMFVKREEFARQCQYIGSGSAREYCRVANISEIKVPLPSIEVQREYVAAYKSLLQLAEQNEALAEPLQMACNSYMAKLKSEYTSFAIGDYIEIDQEKNKEGFDLPFMGIDITKKIVPTSASTDGLDRRKYLIVRKNKLVFSGMQTGRDVAIRLAIHTDENPVLISSAYTTFVVNKEDNLMPDFLYLNFISSEMDRIGWFYSDSSVRSNLDWDRFCEIKIPVPPIEVQRSIVALYHCAEEARAIAREAREQLKKLAPAMVQRAANTPVEV